MPQSQVWTHVAESLTAVADNGIVAWPTSEFLAAVDLVGDLIDSRRGELTDFIRAQMVLAPSDGQLLYRAVMFLARWLDSARDRPDNPLIDYRLPTLPDEVHDTYLACLLAIGAREREAGRGESAGGKGPGQRAARPADEQAYQEYQAAEHALGNEISDDEAYDWVRENYPGDETPPKRVTWKGALSRGRKAAGNPKNQPRTGRTGRSVVRRDAL